MAVKAIPDRHGAIRASRLATRRVVPEREPPARFHADPIAVKRLQRRARSTSKLSSGTDARRRSPCSWAKLANTVPGAGEAWRTPVNQEELTGGCLEDHRDTEKRALRACERLSARGAPQRIRTSDLRLRSARRFTKRLGFRGRRGACNRSCSRRLRIARVSGGSR